MSEGGELVSTTEADTVELEKLAVVIELMEERDQVEWELIEAIAAKDTRTATELRRDMRRLTRSALAVLDG